MKKIFLSLVLFQSLVVHAIASDSVARSAEIRFVNIEWGEVYASACQKIKRNNFLEVDTDYKDIKYFEGILFNVKSDVMVGLISGCVHSIDIHFEKRADFLGFYKKINKLLKDKYGNPKEVVRDYSEPYNNNSKNKEQGIKEGKIVFMDMYRDFNGNIVFTSIDDELGVWVSYKSKLGFESYSDELSESELF